MEDNQNTQQTPEAAEAPPAEPAEPPKDDEEPPAEPAEPPDGEPPAEPDMVAQAQAQNEALKAELEALKNSDTNIFEQNEILKKELEDAKKLAEMAEENKTLQNQLEAIKKNSLIGGMIADGRLDAGLKEWADDMSFDQLQTFAKSAPRQKNILQEQNPVDQSEDGDMEEWKEKQSKSRIL